MSKGITNVCFLLEYMCVRKFKAVLKKQRLF